MSKFWIKKRSLCVFELPTGGSGAAAHWKARRGLPICVNITVTVTVTEGLVLRPLLEDRGRITESTLNGTFSLSVTAEALRANIDWKSAFSKEVGQFKPNFHIVGDVPREQFFAQIEKVVNALQLCCYLLKETL